MNKEKIYQVKEVYLTLQGEGAQAGRTAVFLRFAGCNLWSGREEDRSSAICSFCDTDFRGTDGPQGGRYTAQELAEVVAALWLSPQTPTKPNTENHAYVVCTGGEPLLQLDESLIQALKQKGFAIGVETNGTLPAPAGIDWLCLSPKAGTQCSIVSGDELKLVYPQAGICPEDFAKLDFKHFFLQPMDGPELNRNIRLCIEYCSRHPQWRLSLQWHKMIGIK